MLTVWKLGEEYVRTKALYCFCNFSANLKLSQNKKFIFKNAIMT